MKHKQTIYGGEALTKVVFELEDSDWHDHASETLWASRRTNSVYNLRNIPFYIYGVSFGDSVVAERRNNENIFRRIHERGGHSTYRIFITDEHQDALFEQSWGPLGELGCFYERATDYLVAVDVPPEVNIYDAYDALEKGRISGVWDFEEGHCGHPLTGEGEEPVVN